MHVMIRKYRMQGSMDDLMQRVEELFAAQLSPGHEARSTAPVQVPPGIVSYQAVETGPDTLLTITVFESKELLDRAQAGAAAIRESLREFAVEEVDTDMGEVRIHRDGTSGRAAV